MKRFQVGMALIVLFAFTVGAAGMAVAKGHKVDVCHNLKPVEDTDGDGDYDVYEGNTISVSGNAEAAHLAHGDLAGACDAQPPVDLDDDPSDNETVVEK